MMSVEENGKADMSAWLAVAAGTLGALMATLDISIVNSALPTIQGEIGASSTEGTWVATSYLVAEIVIIPLTGWLERLLGLRNFLLGAAILFTGFSVVCGLSNSLLMMIVGRAGQGITGGAMIPTAMTIIVTRLPRSQQPMGTALFGATATVGPVLGPLLGGWLTENYTWHYAFFLNVPVCGALIALLLIGLPYRAVDGTHIREADWLGIFGLTLGLGGLTVMLEEGQRLVWFDSGIIQAMALTSFIGFAMLAAGQLTAARPVIKLSLLADRQFGSIAMMIVVLGMVIYGTSYVIPQFLSAIADYNAWQSGLVVIIAAFPTLVMMRLMPYLLRTLDIRLAVTGGLLILAAASFIDCDLTIASSGTDFIHSQLLRGVGQSLSMFFMNQAVVSSISAEDAGDASGLINGMRNLGGSIALASLSVLQDQRTWFHSRRLEETLNANSPAVQDYMTNAAHLLGGQAASLRYLGQQIQIQSLVFTYDDIFWLLTIITVLVIPLVFFLRPFSDGPPAEIHHL
jgi:MFS transporter, DHA2 family, multidrug resistance protein